MKRAWWLAGVASLAMLDGGCTTYAGSHQEALSLPPASTPAAGALVATDGPGWSSAGLDGSVPVPGSCRVGRSADGRPLPDPRCTPGAVDATVTQSDLAETICRVGGYTSSVRPPESLTEPFKVRDLEAYGESGGLGLYELDHLVPLELGGSSDTSNLWPELNDHPPGAANSKDPVEDSLHDMVCAAVAGRPYLPLAEAQVLIASDWTQAIDRGRAELVDPGAGRSSAPPDDHGQPRR